MAIIRFKDPAVHRAFESGLKYINDLLTLCRYDDQGNLLSGPCYGCRRILPVRDDVIELVTGDGLPLCKECFEKTCKSIGT